MLKPKKPQGTPKPTGIYRLLEGKHVGPDYDEEPVPFFDGDEQVGVKFPSRVYVKDDLIKSAMDLAAWDRRKFQKVEQPPGSASTIPTELIKEPVDHGDYKTVSSQPLLEPLESAMSSQNLPSKLDRECGPLEQFSKNDLQMLATEHKVDLQGATRKDEIISRLRMVK